MILWVSVSYISFLNLDVPSLSRHLGSPAIPAVTHCSHSSKFTPHPGLQVPSCHWGVVACPQLQPCAKKKMTIKTEGWQAWANDFVLGIDVTSLGHLKVDVKMFFPSPAFPSVKGRQQSLGASQGLAFVPYLDS